ncbi:unnamed protein product [Miscanthus lutarioriparius]|uniref:Uncharacterized protein n=1 Tax=Miscanthus lutarioriparius TaxID=422564 RepID=A0A811RN52_9POAL|nr:unnamed protein product [Miscanthus lutarioriparius]
MVVATVSSKSSSSLCWRSGGAPGRERRRRRDEPGPACHQPDVPEHGAPGEASADGHGAGVPAAVPGGDGAGPLRARQPRHGRRSPGALRALLLGAQLHRQLPGRRHGRRPLRLRYHAGLWVIDGGAPLDDPRAAAAYRIRFLDLVHAVVSVKIFAAVALLDQNVVTCFYPVPSEDARQVLTVLPIAIGVVGSMLFVTFPTTRHGIGFPLSQH